MDDRPGRVFYGRRDDDGQSGGGYNNHRQSGGEGGDQDHQVMKISSGNVGRIIGPKGSTINEIQRQCSVRININKYENRDGTKDAMITGSPMNIQEAMKMINSKLESGGDYGDRQGERRPPRQYGDNEGNRGNYGGGGYGQREGGNNYRSRDQ